MKKVSNVIWGLVLVAAGVLFALNALDLIRVNIFFDGWWTLFIIVPCGVGLFTQRDKTGNLMGLLIGVFLLLCCREILQFSMIWKLLLPAVIVVIGLKLVFSGLLGRKENQCVVTVKGGEGAPVVGCAVFSAYDFNGSGKIFEGGKLVAVFGGVECDLRDAIIEHDCAIEVAAVFGGVDILVPKNVNVKANVACIFGGVDNLTVANPDGPTLYINGACVFGGADIH